MKRLLMGGFIIALGATGCAESQCDTAYKRHKGEPTEHTSVVCQHPDGTSTLSRYYRDGRSTVIRANLDGDITVTDTDGDGNSTTVRRVDAIDPHAHGLPSQY